MEEKLFCEMMAHIFTIEEILMANHNISYKAINEQIDLNRKSIYNFDNIKSIDILDNEIFITDDILSDQGVYIGKYSTEERAKEILQEVCEIYEVAKRYECSSNDDIIIFLRNTFTYEMPEK